MASGTTYFVQECPTCGRNLQVRVEYLGKRVACQHCSGRFNACPSQAEPGTSESEASVSTLMDRAEQLLRSAEASGIHARSSVKHPA